jgi:hypothetical protein
LDRFTVDLLVFDEVVDDYLGLVRVPVDEDGQEVAVQTCLGPGEVERRMASGAGYCSMSFFSRTLASTRPTV